jgi:hypothetical protein
MYKFKAILLVKATLIYAVTLIAPRERISNEWQAGLFGASLIFALLNRQVCLVNWVSVAELPVAFLRLFIRSVVHDNSIMS